MLWGALLAVTFAAEPSAAVGDGRDAQAPAVEPGAIVRPGTDIAALSLDDLLSSPIEVASKRRESTREAAAVITVFTREEIIASGARDLAELLWLVPGFSENLDVQNVVGLGVRGIWSYEGKVLLMVDGIDMTEQLYGTNQLGMHYLTQNIERLEIIRGPGSAVYGGNAGMAVISIITRGAKDLNGIELDARYGQGQRTFSDRSIGLNAAHTFELGGGVGVSLSGYLGQGNRSDGTYVDSVGNPYSLADNKSAATDPMNLNAAVTWQGLKVRFLFDRYGIGSVDGYGGLTTITRGDTVTTAPNWDVFQTVALDARYEFKLSDHLTIEPRLLYRHQLPWWSQDPGGVLYYEKTAQRFLASVTVNWAIAEGIHFLGGVEAFDDLAALPHPEHANMGVEYDFANLSPNSPNQAQLANVAAFAQLQWDNPIANLTLGGRAEYHSVAGASLVPRIAATKRIDRLTAKVLFSGAFRAPSFENLNEAQLNGAPASSLDPERIWVGETELSYQMLDWAFLSVNAFAIEIEKPIVYLVDPATNTEGYENSGHVGSRGLEAELQVRGSAGFARLSYSFSEAAPNTTVPNFLQVDGTRSSLVGMPGHKFTFFAHVKLPKGFAFNATALWVGTRKGSDANANEAIYGSALIINSNFRWEAPESIFAKGFFASFGVENALDAQLPFLQAYNGGHPPIPGRGRDFFLRVGYSFSK